MRIPLACLAILALVVGSYGSAWASDGPVITARHQGIVTATSIRWHSDYLLRSDAVQSIDLAFPLPLGTTMEPSSSVTPIEHDGRIVGFRSLRTMTWQNHLEVTLVEPLDRQVASVRIAPPIAAGDEVQVATVTGGGELRFEPDTRTLLERHVGFFAPAEMPPSAREACDRAFDRVWNRRSDDPMYLQATPVLVADQGIRGRLSSDGDRARTGTLWAGGIFVVLVVGLALLQRRLAASARLEAAEKMLAAEFAELERNEPL